MKRDPDGLIKKLKDAIEKTGMPQYELAALIGCPPATLNRWVMGKFAPSVAWQRVIESSVEVQKLFKQSK